MRIAPRTQFILVIVGMVVLLIIVGAVAVWPQYRTLGVMDAKIADADKEVALQKTRLAQRQEIKDRAAQTDAKWLRLANEVPDSPDLPSLIIELQDLAFSTGVQLTAITPAAPTASKDGTYFIIPIKLTVVGTWADSVEFMQKLNKLDRGLRTTDAKTALYSGTTANPTLPNYAVTNDLDIEAYLIPPAASSTTP
jgi:Tfp pilus assembly protein PilO